MSLPPIVIVPGFFGSKLVHKGTDDLVWVDYPEIRDHKNRIVQDMTLTKKNRSALEPAGILDKIDIPWWFDRHEYSRLVEFLNKNLKIPKKRIKSFGYDWRKSIRLAARHLKRCIADWQKNDFSGDECAIIGHSLGGLVARYYIENLEGEKPVQQLFLIGTPNTGAIENFQALVEGKSPFPGLGFDEKEIRQMSRSFETAYEVLPRAPRQKLFVDDKENGIQPFTDKSWVSRSDVKTFTPMLDSAWKVIKKMPPTSSVPTTVIYSDGLPTVTRATFNGKEIKFSESLAGDGTVPSSSAVTVSGKKVACWPVPFAEHSRLYAHPKAKEILRRSLTKQPRKHVYLWCGTSPFAWRGGVQNKIVAVILDQQGHSFPQACVDIVGSPFMRRQKLRLRRSPHHPGQFESEFRNPRRAGSYKIGLRFRWREDGTTGSEKERDVPLTLRIA